MRSSRRRRSATPLLLVSVLVLAFIIIAAVKLLSPKPVEVDPHEGQVYVNDGFGMVWMTPLEGVDPNPILRTEMTVENGRPKYIGQAYETMYGVDVSEHQWGVDWKQVADSGINFAMIRLGYRGYTEGGLFEDPYYRSNMEGAAANGIATGVYLFSQAISVEEAIEEAEFVIERLEGYELTMPVVYDWEKIEGGGARTDGLDKQVLTDCAKAFCRTINEAGYDACVYFNRQLGYYEYDLSQLTDYMFWIALPGTFPDFYYESELWQYSFTSSVPGIEGETDMNMMFIPVATPEPQAVSPSPSQ